MGIDERMSGLSGDSTHMMRGEVGAPKFRGCLPLLYKEGWELPLPHTLVVISLSLLPLLHLLVIRLAKPWPFSFSTTPRRRAAGGSGGSSTSAAPLDRGNGGRHQAVRVTDRCEFDYITNEIRSRNALCLRAYVLLRLFHPVAFHLLD